MNAPKPHNLKWKPDMEKNEIEVNYNPTNDWVDSDWEKFSEWLKGMLNVGPATVHLLKPTAPNV